MQADSLLVRTVGNRVAAALVVRVERRAEDIEYIAAVDKADTVELVDRAGSADTAMAVDKEMIVHNLFGQREG